ncbi:MAG: TolC family protein [bacterium]|nr:TolC family protein [bacterium]
MTRQVWALTLLLAATASTHSGAQVVTESKFLSDALTNHPGLAVAEAEVLAASGNRRQAGIVANPEISWEREDPDVMASQNTWRLDWRLPFDGRGHRMAAADADIAASRSELDVAHLRIRLELRALFASWYVAVERALALQQNLEKTQELASWLRVRAEEGEAAGVDARRLDLEVEVLQRGYVEARAEAKRWAAAAAAWSSLVTADVKPGRPSLAPPPASVDIGDRPDIRALAHRAEAAESRRRLESRMLEPPEISAGWLEISDGQQSFDGPVFGVMWPLPVFDRNQGRREAAAAGETKARSELDVARRRAEQDVHAAMAAYSELFDMVVHGGETVAVDDVVDSVFAAFEAGEAGLTDVLDALRVTVAVRMARLGTLALAMAGERDLEAALGRPVLSGGSS